MNDKEKLDVMGLECLSLMGHLQDLIRSIFIVYTVNGAEEPLDEDYKNTLDYDIQNIKFKAEELERYLDT